MNEQDRANKQPSSDKIKKIVTLTFFTIVFVAIIVLVYLINRANSRQISLTTRAAELANVTPIPVSFSPKTFTATIPTLNTKIVEVTLKNNGTSPVNILLTTEIPATPTVTPLPQPTNWWVAPKNKIDSKIENNLRAAKSLNSAKPAKVSALLYLPEQADTSSCRNIKDWKEQGWCVLNKLQTTAKTQEKLTPELKRQQATGNIKSFKQFFIINAISIDDATEDGIRSLANQEQVAYIEDAAPLSIPKETAVTTLKPEAWGVSRVGAPFVWSNYGITGQGIVVANIDTGVDGTHSELKPNYRGTIMGTNTYNWFTTNACVGPCDNILGHGTHTMGTMAGKTVGVAPGVTWIAARGCESYSCNVDLLFASAQWLLAPYQGNSNYQHDFRPDLRPQIVNNSWGGTGSNLASHLWFSGMVWVMHDDGILPIFSAGNSGPQKSTITSPGDNQFAFAVGASNKNDEMFLYSGRGPGLIPGQRNKPEIVAPGVDIVSAYPGNQYAGLSGTSMAAPHVAGCAALLLQAGATPNEALGAMMATTYLPPEANRSDYDFSFGHGVLNCYAAVATFIPWIWMPQKTVTIEPGKSVVLKVVLTGKRNKPLQQGDVFIFSRNADGTHQKIGTIPVTVTDTNKLTPTTVPRVTITNTPSPTPIRRITITRTPFPSPTPNVRRKLTPVRKAFPSIFMQ